METSVCFSNDRIQAVYGDQKHGRILVKGFASASLPAGTMINGTITDDRALASAFADFRGVNPTIPFKNIRLAISGSAVYTRLSNMPPLRGDKVESWVGAEFSNTDTVGELVYDYAVLRADGKNGVTALLCAAPKELLKSYIDLFASLKIEISGIDIVQNCQRKLMSMFPSLKDSTYIVLTLDGSSVDSTLYSGGLYKLSNRTRLLSERGTPAYASELEHVISGMLQFQRADRNAGGVSGIYAAGFSDTDTDMIKELGAAFGVDSGFLSDTDSVLNAGQGFRLCDYAYTVGNLIKE